MLRILLLAAAIMQTAAPAGCQAPLSVSGLPEGAPCSVAASATGRALILELDIGRGWHAYSRDTGGGMPVRVTIDETCGFRAAGPLAAPEGEDGRLRGAVRLSLPLDPRDESRILRATLELQICDALECLEPMSIRISGAVRQISVLLVVAAAGDRAERIAGFLRARDFNTGIATYEDVAMEDCDARDVVVADSDVFRRHGVSAAVVKRFPATSSPVVAVGFLGTQLVAAHGLAMTSGYI